MTACPPLCPPLWYIIGCRPMSYPRPSNGRDTVQCVQTLSGRPSNIADVSAGCPRRQRVQNEEEVIAVLRIALQQRMGERLLDDDVEEARRLIVSDHRSNVCFGLARSELHFSLNDEVASAGSPGIRHGSLCRPLSETVLHEADGESAAPMPPSHECSSDLCRLAAHPILGPWRPLPPRLVCQCSVGAFAPVAPSVPHAVVSARVIGVG